MYGVKIDHNAMYFRESIFLLYLEEEYRSTNDKTLVHHNGFPHTYASLRSSIARENVFFFTFLHISFFISQNDLKLAGEAKQDILWEARVELVDLRDVAEGSSGTYCFAFFSVL